ncbi:MAG: glutaredoxin [Caldisphaera sp.]|nr:MAG: glutaredoxin [Caldisphaera sp.]
MSGKYYELDLDEAFINELKETLAYMVNPVTIDVFIGEGNCETCDDTVKLIKAIADASPTKNGKKMIEIRIFDKAKEGDLAEFQKQGVERIPSVTLIGGLIKYSGIPAGEEIRGFIETIMRLSENDSGLENETKVQLKTITNNVHVETVVTPSCPYCPYAVLLANMFAYEAYKQNNPKILSETVEAYENTDIAEKYGVMSVPAIALNGVMSFVGVPYEEDFVTYVKAAAENKLKEITPKEEGEATGI